MKERRTNAIVTFLLFLMLAVGQGFSAWDGVSMETASMEGDYYIIDSEAKLAWFANKANQTHSAKFTENAKLTADLDMGSHLWIPICAGSGGTGIDKVMYCQYAATFDGNGHTISNLKMVSSELEEINPLYVQNVGFIGAFTGTLKGLTLENVIVLGQGNGGKYVTGGNAYAKPVSIGTLVGWANGKVQNCRATGEIVTSGIGQSVGGLVGNAGGGSITGSVSEVTVNASGVAYAGGIVGYTKNTVSISSCVYAGGGVYAEGSGEIDGKIYESAAGAIVGTPFSNSTVNVENVYYDDSVIGNACGRKEEQINGNITGASDVNNEEIVCVLNGGTWNANEVKCENAKSSDWSVGVSGLSFKGSDGYKITFDANGGEFPVGAKTTKPMALNASISAEEIATPSRGDDFAFAGWATSKNASEPSSDLGTVTGSTTIYAVWKSVYTITFNASQGTFPDGETVKTVRVVEGGIISEEGFSVPDTTRIENKKYFFTGWALTQKDLLPADAVPDTVHLADQTVDGNKTIYAVWTAAQIVTVTFNPNGHGTTLIDYVNVDKGQPTQKPDDPTADNGYTFQRWCETSESCSEEFDFGSGIQENITLYASWEPVTYHITYDLNGATGSHNNPLDYTVETETFALDDPTLSDGYAFEGWFYDENLSDKANSITKGTSGDKTVYAKWSVSTYTVTYRAGSYGAGELLSVKELYGTPVVLENGSYTREGYTQDGWSTSDGGEKAYALGAVYSANADITLFPHWIEGDVEIDQYGAITVYTYADGHKEAVIDATSKEDIPTITDVTVSAVTFNRDFATGAKSTIVLPFSISVSKVQGGTFYEIAKMYKVDGKWAVGIRVLGNNATLNANTPYIVVANATNLTFDVSSESPVTLNTSTMNNVSIDAYESAEAATPIEENAWTFKGTYQYWVFGNLPEFGRAYGFSAEAKNDVSIGAFVRGGAGATIRPLRAYLVYEGGQSSSKTASLNYNSAFTELPDEVEVVVLDEQNNVTERGVMNAFTGQIRMDRWYDLQGRRLKGEPKTQGTYYHNGKKVIVK